MNAQVTLLLILPILLDSILCLSLVSSAEILEPGSAESAEVYVCKKGVDDVTAEPVSHQGGVEIVEAYDLVMSQEGVDDQSPHIELAESTGAITKY